MMHQNLDPKPKMLMLYGFSYYILYYAFGLGSECAADMDQESRMMILYCLFVLCFAHGLG